MTVKDILILQKRELGNKLKELYIERDLDSKRLKTPLMKIIIGPRRSGKSFFTTHHLKKQEKFGYVNFDDEQLVDVKDYNEIMAAVDAVYGSPKLVFFDEIQNLPKWELFVNRLQRQGYDIILSGSNSKLLSRELATHLTGRHTVINMFPFSFREFLKFNEKELTSAEIKSKLDDYIVFGGYPEPLIKKIDHKEYLSTLFNSIIYKDIVKRYKLRVIQGIEDLAFYLLSNISNEYSYNSLCRITKIKSIHTIQKYLSYMEESYMFFSLHSFSYKVKNQISSNKKIYCIDNGFIYSKAFKSSRDKGKLYENIVAVELKKKEAAGKINIYYWKNAQQEEVDFLIKKDMKVDQLIQVCYDLQNPETKKREVRALIKAGKELRCRKLLIITENYEAEEKAEWFGMKARINFMPLWKWLLES